ncbi:Endo-1,3(4)-beta-glucanase, partial [Phytophthora palmivora]
MGKPTNRITTNSCKQEFSKLEQTLAQTADDAVNCLKVLKGTLAEFDSRYKLFFINTSKFFMRSDIRAAKDTASELRSAAHQIAECEAPTESEITAARSAMHATSDVMNELVRVARMYDKKNFKSRGITGVVVGLFGGKEAPKKQSKGSNQGGMENKRVGSEGILRAPDTVEEVVTSTLCDCFSGFSTLQHQIATAEKSLSPQFSGNPNEAVFNEDAPWSVLAIVSTLLFAAAVFGVFKPGASTLRSATTVAPDKFDLFTPIFNAEAPPESLFNHTDAHKKLLPPKFLAAGLVGSRPIPTNDWWGNMIGATTEEDVVYPVWTNPYSVTPSIFMEPYGLTMNYPYTTRLFGGGLTGNGDAEMYYLHGQVPEFTFSATEFSNASHPIFEVFDWDDLSVQLRFLSREDSSKKFEATLASGMAFVTARYSGLTPRFQTVYNISTINGLDSTETVNRPLTNNRYVLQFNNG